MSGFSNQILDGSGTLVRDQIQSSNYVAGVSGWILARTGNAELNGVTVRGSIIVGTPGGQRIEIGPGSTIRLYDSTNTLVGTLQPGSLILDPNQALTVYEFDVTKPNILIGNNSDVQVGYNLNDVTQSYAGVFQNGLGTNCSVAIGPADTHTGTTWNPGYFQLNVSGDGTPAHDVVAVELAAPTPGPFVSAPVSSLRVFSTSHDGATKPTRVEANAHQFNCFVDTGVVALSQAPFSLDHIARTAKSIHAWVMSVAAAATDALEVQLDADAAPRWAVRGDGLVRIKEGLADSAMGTAVLVAGTVTVPTVMVDANSRIMLTTQVPGGAVGTPYVASRINGTSFTIKSTQPTDTSTVAWHITEGF